MVLLRVRGASFETPLFSHSKAVGSVILCGVVVLPTIYRRTVFIRLVVGYFDFDAAFRLTASAVAGCETDDIDPAIAILIP